MTAYYNEHDPKAAAWLRELIKCGHIAEGIVDERSIEDVTPIELAEFTQCHFFAGIGVWSYALRQAGWPDERPVWTGSCPCQPFSAAGKGGGFDDERHLWPSFFHLIKHGKRESVPVFGEQVASPDGLAWLDLVQSDMEGEGYAFGALDLCAAGFGAPHIRQRLYWVADAADQRRQHGAALVGSDGTGIGEGRQGIKPCTLSQPSELGVPDGAGRRTWIASAEATGYGCSSISTSKLRQLANADGGNTSAKGIQRSGRQRQFEENGCSGVEHNRPGPTNGFWRNADWLRCRDGKWRPVESGTFPLAHGAAARVGRLRGYGNALNAETAKAFIEICLA